MLDACRRGPLKAQVSFIDQRDATADELAGLVHGTFEVHETV
jgi:hypothetical protein